MKVNEITQVEEGWKSTLGAGVIGSALALGGLTGKWGGGDEQPTGHSVSGQVEKVPEKPDKTPVITDPKTPEEHLIKTAVDSGIRGNELASLLAQAAHESGNFKYMVELGGTKYFRKYDPEYSPRKANILGNTKVGDGARYKGRGMIQITGRYWYSRVGKAIGQPLEANPELAADPAIAAQIAVWFWKNQVKRHVDDVNDTHAVTKRINPGMKGIDDRVERHAYMRDKYGDYDTEEK